MKATQAHTLQLHLSALMAKRQRQSQFCPLASNQITHLRRCFHAGPVGGENIGERIVIEFGTV